MLALSLRFLTTKRILKCPYRHFAMDTVISGLLAAASTGIVTFLVKQREIDGLKKEMELQRDRERGIAEELARSESYEENLKITKEELSKRILELVELRSTHQKLEALLETEKNFRLKKEEEFVRATEKILALESNLSDLNSKYIEESRLLSQFKGRLESAQAAVQMAREQSVHEKDARVSLEKTVETSLRMNIERIREELVSKTRDVVGPAVIETLRSSLKQTPVLGRFGEIQLEYLLEEYFTLGNFKLYDRQVTLDSKKRLDAVLKLPVENGVLHIIVDAKTPNIFQSDTVSVDHVTVNQLRTRIMEVLATLQKTDYVEYYRRHLITRSSSKATTIDGKIIDENVCDFVLMFLPVDYALLAVDEKVLKKCLETKVIICTPSLMILQIEFIKMAWRHRLPANAIADVEGDFTILVDSLAVLSKDLDKCGSSLNAATTKAEKATNRLKKSLAGVFANSVGDAK